MYLHRVRANVLPVRRGSLPVCAIGRSRGVRDGGFVYLVAHAGADAGDAVDEQRACSARWKGEFAATCVSRLRRPLRTRAACLYFGAVLAAGDRKSTRLNS